MLPKATAPNTVKLPQPSDRERSPAAAAATAAPPRPLERSQGAASLRSSSALEASQEASLALRASWSSAVS